MSLGCRPITVLLPFSVTFVWPAPSVSTRSQPRFDASRRRRRSISAGFMIDRSGIYARVSSFLVVRRNRRHLHHPLAAARRADHALAAGHVPAGDVVGVACPVAGRARNVGSPHIERRERQRCTRRHTGIFFPVKPRSASAPAATTVWAEAPSSTPRQ